MKKILSALVPLIIVFCSCKKDANTISPESSKVLTVVNWDSSKFGGYVSCGNAGLVDGNGLYYQFIASSEEGEVTITNFAYHINVNDNSRPYTMISMWDGYTGGERDILISGPDVEFSNMRCTVPEGNNGRFFGANLTYSGIGRNGVVSGRTVSSVTLTSVTYVDRSGLKKTIHPNYKSPDRMSAYSYMWLQPVFYGNAQNGLHIGQNRIFQQYFNSAGGDELLKEVPLKILMTDCSMGSTPQISVSVSDGTSPGTIVPATVVKVNDTTFIVKLPQPVLVKKDKYMVVDFYGDVQTMTITPNTRLRTSLGNLKYLKYVEVFTGTEFLSSNEFFMWTQVYYSPNNIDQYYSELYP